MSRYLYNRQKTPPAPFVHVTVTNQRNALSRDMLPALVDPGADRTVIPSALVAELGLHQLDAVHLAGLGGEPTLTPTFLVDLAIREHAATQVEVAAVENEKYVLLGRDVLNRYRVLLDGPNLALEIDGPNPS